jgi:hypothetical protein
MALIAVPDNRLGGVGHCFAWHGTRPCRELVLICQNIGGVMNLGE